MKFGSRFKRHVVMENEMKRKKDGRRNPVKKQGGRFMTLELESKEKEMRTLKIRNDS